MAPYPNRDIILRTSEKKWAFRWDGNGISRWLDFGSYSNSKRENSDRVFFLCHDFNKMHLCWFLENETTCKKSSPGFGKYVVAFWRSFLHFALGTINLKLNIKEHTLLCCASWVSWAYALLASRNCINYNSQGKNLLWMFLLLYLNVLNC